MDADGFVADLHRKPEMLGRLADVLAEGNPWASVVPEGIERVVLIGMGSSAYAGGVVAARMRARGLVAVSEVAATTLMPDWGRQPWWWPPPLPVDRWKRLTPLIVCPPASPLSR